MSSDLLAEAAASSGISGPILLSMGSLNDQAVANLKTDHPLAQGRRLASALKSQAATLDILGFRMWSDSLSVASVCKMNSVKVSPALCMFSL